MKKLLAVGMLLISGCTNSLLVEQYLGALRSVSVGDTYLDMINKAGYKPQHYECVAPRECIAFYMTNYKEKTFKRFYFHDKRIVSIKEY